MLNLLAKMEAELNGIHKKRQGIVIDGTKPISKNDRQTLIELNERQVKLRKMINDYIAIQNQFLELTGAYSIPY
jgi:hypothetical protein